MINGRHIQTFVPDFASHREDYPNWVVGVMTTSDKERFATKNRISSIGMDTPLALLSFHSAIKRPPRRIASHTP
jgi:hypothetical protein